MLYVRVGAPIPLICPPSFCSFSLPFHHLPSHFIFTLLRLPSIYLASFFLLQYIFPSVSSLLVISSAICNAFQITFIHCISAHVKICPTFLLYTRQSASSSLPVLYRRPFGRHGSTGTRTTLQWLQALSVNSHNYIMAVKSRQQTYMYWQTTISCRMRSACIGLFAVKRKYTNQIFAQCLRQIDCIGSESVNRQRKRHQKLI